MTETGVSIEVRERASRTRSPAYPAINLKTALDRARTFYSHEKRNAAALLIAVSHWGYSSKSGAALTTVAALKSFGLMVDTESIADRRLQLTETALRIILDTRTESPERDTAIKKAALLPKIHAELWKKFGVDLIADGNLRHELIFDWKFNENSVDDFIQEYKDTISFAKLVGSDVLSANDEDKKCLGDNGNRAEESMTSESTPSLPTANAGERLSTAQMHSVTRAAYAGTGSIGRTRSNVWTLSGDFTAKLDLIGEPQSEEDLDALRDYVEITIKALARSMKKTREISDAASAEKT